MERDKRDIYICYDQANAAEAARLATHFENTEGWSCWYADRDLPLGSNNGHDYIEKGNIDAMLKAVENCSAFLVVSSANIMTSSCMQVVLSHAMAHDKVRLVYKPSGISGYDAYLGYYNDPNWEQVVNALCMRIRRVLHISNRSINKPDYEDTLIAHFAGYRGVLFLAILLIGVTGAVIVFGSLTQEQGFLASGFTRPIDSATLIDSAAHIDSLIPVVTPVPTPSPADLAREGDVDAMYQYAQIHMVFYLFDSAAYWFRKAATEGHANAQAQLAMLYARGHGLRRDYEQAAYWFRLSADQGTIEAMTNLGWMYEYGNGVELDVVQAVYWYQKAADLDDAHGQNNLGVMYANGHGVERNYEMAAYWFRRAAIQNDIWAAGHLGMMYEFGAGVAQDYRQAIYWYQKADSPDAQDWVAERLERLLELAESNI